MKYCSRISQNGKVVILDMDVTLVGGCVYHQVLPYPTLSIYFCE